MNSELYRFRLETEHRGVRFVNTFVLHPAMSRAIRPIDHCDDGLTAVISGGCMPHESRQLLLERETIIREVSSRLVTGILHAMAQYDLKNGYPPIPTHEKDQNQKS